MSESEIKNMFDRSGFEVEIINHNDRKIVEQLVSLEEKCLPLEMRNPVGYDYFSGLLRSAEHINLLLKFKGKIIGLLVAKEYKRIYNLLSNHDPDLRKKKKRLFYIDLIQVHPRFKINGGLSFLVCKLIEQALNKKLQGFCIHARKKNGLSKFLQKIFFCKKIHSIDNWLGFGEQFDYLELSVSRRNFKNILNRLDKKKVFNH